MKLVGSGRQKEMIKRNLSRALNKYHITCSACKWCVVETSKCMVSLSHVGYCKWYVVETWKSMVSLSDSIAITNLLSPLPSNSNRLPKVLCINGNFGTKRITSFPAHRRLTCTSLSSSRDETNSLNFDVPFPSDYTELLNQAKQAAELAMKDGKQLMEIEFPTAGLESVPGDGEGGNEMTGSMQLIREFCDHIVSPEKATRTRIFFPEANEVKFARQSAFAGASFKLDYLTKPSLFEDFGFTEKVKMADQVQPGDELFLVAYPYFNVNEMLVVEELYKEAVFNTARKLIIFNGELDRIRSGYYPPFFYPKLAALSKTLLPMMETIYYIHNFKGRNGGTLFRCYPGSWKVLRKVRNKYTCLHQQEVMPSLKEVALDILPSA